MTGNPGLSKGQVEAHAAAVGFAGGVGERQAAIAAAIELALVPEPDLPGLAEAMPDTVDLLGRMAEQVNAERRVRGRPPGATNRRNDEVFDYLEARGFKAPEMRLMEIVAADPMELAKAMSSYYPGPVAVPFERVLEVIKLQARAAADLMPYKLAKKPQAVEVNRKTLHVFMAGPLSAGLKLAEQGFDLTNGAAEIIEQNQGGQSAAERRSYGPRSYAE